MTFPSVTFRSMMVGALVAVFAVGCRAPSVQDAGCFGFSCRTGGGGATSGGGGGGTTEAAALQKGGGTTGAAGTSRGRRTTGAAVAPQERE